MDFEPLDQELVELCEKHKTDVDKPWHERNFEAAVARVSRIDAQTNVDDLRCVLVGLFPFMADAFARPKTEAKQLLDLINGRKNEGNENESTDR